MGITEVALFQDITTEEALQKIEKRGESYSGLYVDMENGPERKYVKDEAAAIAALLKKLDRARIDKSAAYKKRVESEAARIKERLEEANRPFTLLIDAHKAKRAKTLAEEKRIKEARELALQINKDHEFALLIDDKMTLERAQREIERAEYEQKLKDDAAIEAVAKHDKFLKEKKSYEDAEKQKKLDDIEHRKMVEDAAVVGLLAVIADDRAQAEVIVRCIREGKIPNVYIQY